MFKVGDRVRCPQNGGGSCIHGEILSVGPNTNKVRWFDWPNRPNYEIYHPVSIFEPAPRAQIFLELAGGGQVATPTYKPGDKIVATCEHTTKNLMLASTRARPGDVGTYTEYVSIRETWPHLVKFAGIDYWCGDEHIAPYHSTTPAQRPTLSCARCGEPNQYAESNLGNGGYACYSCRKYHAYAIGGA